MSRTEADPEGGEGGLEHLSDFKLPNFLKIEIIGFCLTTSLHKSNFQASQAYHTHHVQNWSIEPLSEFRLDPPLVSDSVGVRVPPGWRPLISDVIPNMIIFIFTG